MTPDEKFQQAIEDLGKISQALETVSNVMNNTISSQEDFDRVLQEGIKVLEEMEETRGGTDL